MRLSVAFGWFPQLSPSSLLAVGQDKQPFPSVACTDFRRSAESRRSSVAQVSKLAENGIESENKVPRYVFEKGVSGTNLANDSSDVRPKVSWIVLATLLTSHGERLTQSRVARSDDVHDTIPRATAEVSNIAAPNRTRLQGLLLHPRQENGRTVGFPLDCTNKPGSGQDDFESHVEAGQARTK